MIAEFTVKNYRSFKEKHTLALYPVTSKELEESNVFEIAKNKRLLKSAVIYGANASGKSNFFRALTFFRNFAALSGPRKQAGEPIVVDPFAFSKQTENEPSSFELIFFLKNSEEKYIRYRYGFSVTQEEVLEEYLFAIINVREITLFTRKKQSIKTTDYFREGARITQAIRPNSSFLSVCAQINGEIAIDIINYFQKMIVTSGLRDLSSSTKRRLQNSKDDTQKTLLDFLHYADIQVNEIKVEHEPVFPHLSTQLNFDYVKEPSQSLLEQEIYYFGHDFFDKEKNVGTMFLPEQEESSGTQKLFAYSIPITSALENGTPLFIDEFDAQLHPLILENIIKLFNSPEKNPKNAQLVISCHAVNILTNKLFRRDQIWFCEKDQYGATDLYSLVEYDEPVRKDAAYGKNYLQGKYGGVPYINEVILQIGNH